MSASNSAAASPSSSSKVDSKETKSSPTGELSRGLLPLYDDLQYTSNGESHDLTLIQRPNLLYYSHKNTHASENKSSSTDTKENKKENKAECPGFIVPDDSTVDFKTLANTLTLPMFQDVIQNYYLKKEPMLAIAHGVAIINVCLKMIAKDVFNYHKERFIGLEKRDLFRQQVVRYTYQTKLYLEDRFNEGKFAQTEVKLDTQKVEMQAVSELLLKNNGRFEAMIAHNPV